MQLLIRLSNDQRKNPFQFFLACLLINKIKQLQHHPKLKKNLKNYY